MQFLLLIIKNLIKYTALVFVTYVAVMNFAISFENILEIFIQSLCLAIILVPPSLINYFGASIAKNARYKKELTINRNAEDTFKVARNLLKTMSEITLIDSSSENKTYKLESEFSKIDISIKSIDDNTVEIQVSSIPKVYHKLYDFNKYTKDVKNIIILLKLHLIPEEDKNKYKEIEDACDDYSEEFKPSLIVYYRLIKSWLMFFLTLAIYFALYLFALSIVPEGSTLIFFTLLFLYIFYIFTNEITNDAKYVICPACEKTLISNPFNFKEYKLTAKCKYCEKSLFKATKVEN